MRTIFSLSLAAASLFAMSAAAQVTRQGGRPGTIPPVTQEQPAAGSPGGAANPGAPATTGATARTGKVKPPGSPLGGENDQEAQIEKRQRAMDRRVRAGICRGC